MNHTIYEYLTHYPTGKILAVEPPLELFTRITNDFKAPNLDYIREYKIELKIGTLINISEEFLRDSPGVEDHIRSEGFEQIKHHLYKDGLKYFRELEGAIMRNDKASMMFFLRELENEVLGCT